MSQRATPLPFLGNLRDQPCEPCETRDVHRARIVSLQRFAEGVIVVQFADKDDVETLIVGDESLKYDDPGAYGEFNIEDKVTRSYGGLTLIVRLPLGILGSRIETLLHVTEEELRAVLMADQI